MYYPLLNKLILQFMINDFPWNKIIPFDIFLDFRHIINQILNNIVFFDNFLLRNHNDLRFINQVFLIVRYTGLVTECFYLLLLQLYHQLLLSFLVLDLSLLVVLLKLNVLWLGLDYVHLRCWDGLRVHFFCCIGHLLVWKAKDSLLWRTLEDFTIWNDLLLRIPLRYCYWFSTRSVVPSLNKWTIWGGILLSWLIHPTKQRLLARLRLLKTWGVWQMRRISVK